MAGKSPNPDDQMVRGRWRALLLGAVPVICVAPFLGVLSGQCLFFRDLAGQFFPGRRFAVRGLALGQAWYWNPYLHEGVPVALPPVSYPPDLLQVLWPSQHALSVLLVLHVPLAALAMVLLARRLGLGPAGAGAGALAYALGGYALSTVNLYLHLEALAWAPLVVATLISAHRSRRDMAIAALTSAIALSTTGVEIVALAWLVAVVLAVRHPVVPTGLRAAATLLLATGLAAPTILHLALLTRSSARASGFDPSVVLAHSIHPWSLLQVVVGNLHGDLSRVVDRWWGMNFFPQGFPYITSLYLGAPVIALAIAGAKASILPRRRLALLALLGIWVGLGAYGGWRPIVESLAPLRSFRFPVKAFFLTHISVALLAAGGIDAFLRHREKAETWLMASATALGVSLVLSGPILALLPGVTTWYLQHAFPPVSVWSWRQACLASVVEDAQLGGWMALGVAGLAATFVLRPGRMRPGLAAAGILAIVAVDLLRTGVGLNPTVSPAFYQLSPEASAMAERLRRQDARIYTCDPDTSPAYHLGRRAHGNHHVAWTFAVWMETLTPDFNIEARVRSGMTMDRTMLVPPERLLEPKQTTCAALPTIVGALQRGGITHVITLDPVHHPDLQLVATYAPSRVAPVVAHVYAIKNARPRLELRPAATHDTDAREVEHPPSGSARFELDTPGHVVVAVHAPAPEGAELLLRDAWAPGWSVQLGGRPATLLRFQNRHMAVRVPAGSSRVSFRYRPPGLVAGLAIAGLSWLVAIGLAVGVRPSKLWRQARRPNPDEASAEPEQV